MLNWNDLARYRENNRLEAKKAQAVGLSLSRTRRYLHRLKAEGIVAAKRDGRARYYYLTF